MLYKDDWDKSRTRFEAFWNQEIADRCCISVTSPKSGKEEAYNKLKSLGRLHGWGDPEAVVKRSRSLFEVTRFGGESFPGIWLNLGPSGHAGFVEGARYQVKEDTVWFSPILEEHGYDSLKFDPFSELYQMTRSMAKYYAEDSKGDYFISMPDTSGNLDALAYLRGTDDLLIDMISDDNDELTPALELLQQIWEKIITGVYEEVREVNDCGSMIYWIKSWAPGFHSQMQADISVMISPDMYGKLVVPELKKQSDFLEYPLYHLDGAEQIRHLDHLLSIKNIKAIQWTSVSGQNNPSYYIEALKKIQAAGKSLLVSITDPKEVEVLLTDLSSKGLYLVLEVSNEDYVDKLLQLANKLTHE